MDVPGKPAGSDTPTGRTTPRPASLSALGCCRSEEAGMRGRLTGVAVAVCAACALPLATANGQSPDVVEVTANGNAIYDQSNLAFRPASVSARVGPTVRWANTDVILPHTATEDHGLWDLAGNYGMTPVNPAGFGPGTTVQRVFEAGTHLYHCRVHPMQIHGVV